MIYGSKWFDARFEVELNNSKWSNFLQNYLLIHQQKNVVKMTTCKTASEALSYNLMISNWLIISRLGATSNYVGKKSCTVLRSPLVMIPPIFPWVSSVKGGYPPVLFFFFLGFPWNKPSSYWRTSILGHLHRYTYMYTQIHCKESWIWIMVRCPHAEYHVTSPCHIQPWCLDVP